MKKYIMLLMILILFTGCNNKDNKQIVNVLNWSSYIPDEVIDDFEKEYNIKVNYGTYSSNEELLAKITSSKKGTYDVIFPSDYMVELMKSRGLIQKIDKYRLPNRLNLNKIFLNQPYDYNNEYSYPFLSTIVVIAVNKDNIKDNIRGYNDLLNKKYKNNIVLIEDQRIVIGMSLLANRYSMNETNEDSLTKAKEWLLELKNNIKAYDSDSPKTFFITEETDIGIMWNAEAEIAKQENPNIEIIDPIEGHAISTDNYCIVDGSKNIDNAYLFINYLLRNEVSKKIVEEYPYISPNNIIQESNIEPENIFKNGYYVKNIGEHITSYDRLWADIK
ncbi:MAG: spermidine/putrescine ABC transporter substrate-binding protein [Bacilli bacterium]|nr:spermidine/putrescine ABC transporter substrate-binding protein [Bacilli bacterium]